MATPEGRVKAKVSLVLTGNENTYYDMPVPYGYGKSTLDYIGCNAGRYFAIETKASGKLPTDRQKLTMTMMERAGAKIFVIDGVNGQLEELQGWLI